jgi:hypothetical protein
MAYKSYMSHTSHARFSFRVAAALALLFLACDILPTDEFDPTGSQFNLNSDIKIISITGNPETNDMGPMTIAFRDSSRTSGTESAVLPAGLLLRRRNSQTQHLLFLKDQMVTARAETTKTLVGTFCCNEYRAIPDAGDTFDLGPVTDNAELLQIVHLVKDKNISGYTDMWMVQRAVWMVTDSTGLTQAYIDSLNALPAGKTD